MPQFIVKVIEGTVREYTVEAANEEEARQDFEEDCPTLSRAQEYCKAGAIRQSDENPDQWYVDDVRPG